MGSTGFLIERFVERGEAPAVISPAASCSFGELVELTAHWTRELARLGVEPGAVVGVEGDFSPTAIALLLALADRSAVVVPHRAGARAGRERLDEIAQLELCLRVDSGDGARLEHTGRTAAHPLYDELRARGNPGLVQFTSGTSGEPKAAVHDLTRLLEKFRVRRPALSTVAFLAFDHLGGLNTMLHTLSNAAALACPRDRSPETVCALIESHRLELLAATPSFFNLLLLGGAHRRHDLSSLRVVSYGAEPMPPVTLERLRAALPADVRLQQTYGMVEVGALRTRSRDDGSLWLRVGGEGVETRVVDGILQLRARSLLLGYLNAPLPLTADGWLITGDEVEQDGDYLRFVGRASDVINVGGEKVHPAEVEAVVQTVAGVEDVVVRGEPNGLLGEIVVADLWLADPADAPGIARRVKRHCRERLASHKVPVRVRIADERAIGPRHKKERG